MKIKKQNLGWIISGILILVILSYAGFLFYNSQVEKGFQDGLLIGQEQIIVRINQDSTLPVISQGQDGIYINWVKIQEVCSNLK